MEINDKSQYDSTISTSKEASIAKAMEIMMDDIKSRQKIQIITRPKVSLLKGLIPIFLLVISYLFLLINSGSISSALSIKKVTSMLLISIIFLIICIIFTKKFLIWMILIYQRYAPEKVRKLCCFEPSCSEYMKLAIMKYGVIRGVYKGYNRLLRCHWPNGGIDYP